ncbi:MAG: hypothetical protein CL669_05645 [Balneola sp.]|jgi:Co/Zn/Cd efflux system component|nr:hypothetical protein [Balneola sp.]|tara:strand:- start:277 stop:609 length:333 start_codon:yes stop_codon:yes gene_type:complete
MKTPNRVYVALLILAITNVIGGLLYASQDLTSSIVVITISLLIGVFTTLFRIDPTTSVASIMLYLSVSNILMISSIYFVHTVPAFKELLLKSPFMYAATKLKKSEIEKDL